MFQIQEVDVKGLGRTNLNWLMEYAGLQCPCEMSGTEIDTLKVRLLTTQVFQDVAVQVVPNGDIPSTYNLEIEAVEKWTVIPVIRGAFGGGTPLLVAGIYDTHAFGSLWTVGAESRTFGSAPTGGVMWIRAPRWNGGRHYLNLELWRDNRIRSVYDREDQEVAQIYGSATAVIAEALVPLGSNPQTPWQVGLRLNYRQQHELEWDMQKSATERDDFILRPINQKRLLARLVYDDMAVLQQNLQGLRVLLNVGPTWSEEKNQASLEQELFWYGLWNEDWNLVFHEWLGLSDDRSYQSLFFLGGFDSVRGLPDGVMYGNKAVYGNLELRKIFHRSHYVWWQAATYIDYGAAGYTTSDWSEENRTTAGFGLRLAVPQVNRLVFRVDYAWSLDQPKTGSISIGMNQFIDPYRPL
ncbi:MAG: BamA/TamA family outer membrane protein [Pseudobdellovibrionaceae bacterium]|uniref:BamA/TamA family outer membrane protein n=1 Tax=Oligoflexus sp. TaxID=1971216 RepID=UPI0027CE8F50|nr:BamA/TamA family outer membrane protein [Oligoflexus sp.]MDQ3230707.1 BamA/TamA family outer membrane protein [Pseudobdellovibrionaceae bacterium]HYX39249.1 BamA/TamA family outer membrane protein [Oligoflexus sp.]